jgi:hypothetical protein
MRSRTFQHALIALVATTAVGSLVADHHHCEIVRPLLAVTRVDNLEIAGTTDATGNVIARAGVQLSSGTGPTFTSGSGVPAGTQPIGSLYLRTATAQVYQNTNGATAWTLSGITDADKGDLTVSASGATWTIDNGVVTFAKQADLATARFVGRTTSGTGSPEALTGTQATAMLDTVSSSLKGLAPASGGGTTNFLRADGTWTTPATTAAFSGANVYRSAAASINTATLTLVTFDAEDIDVGGYHDNSSNPSRVIAPATGFYHINVGVSYAANTTGRRTITVRKNSAGSSSGGTVVVGCQQQTVQVGATRFECSMIVSFTAGDYFEVFAYQESGGSLALGVGTPADTCAQITFIGS